MPPINPITLLILLIISSGINLYLIIVIWYMNIIFWLLRNFNLNIIAPYSIVLSMYHGDFIEFLDFGSTNKSGPWHLTGHSASLEIGKTTQPQNLTSGTCVWYGTFSIIWALSWSNYDIVALFRLHQLEHGTSCILPRRNIKRLTFQRVGEGQVQTTNFLSSFLRMRKCLSRTLFSLN
jgi:hypothetical protein